MINQERPQPIAFIIGCGRTGTHMIGHFLDGPEARVCFEARPLQRGNPTTSQPHWTWIHAISKNPRVAYRWWPKILENLRLLQKHFAPKLFIDKSNQLMGWTDELLKAFPEAKFIGTTRDVIPTVRSMSKHAGFISDAKGIMGYSESYEVPNLFSGAMSEEFFELDVLGRLAWRWAAARQRLFYLKKTLSPDQFILIDYKDFVKDPAKREDLKEFINCEANDDMGLTDRDKIDQGFFDEEHLKEIHDAVKRYEELHGSIELGDRTNDEGQTKVPKTFQGPRVALP